MAKLWIARWRNNSLHLYNHKPHRVNDFFWAYDGTSEHNSIPLDADMFPEVTFENSPVEVKLETFLT